MKSTYIISDLIIPIGLEEAVFLHNFSLEWVLYFAGMEKTESLALALN